MEVPKRRCFEKSLVIVGMPDIGKTGHLPNDLHSCDCIPWVLFEWHHGGMQTGALRSLDTIAAYHFQVMASVTPHKVVQGGSRVLCSRGQAR